MKLTITSQIKTVSMQSGKVVSIKDGDRYSYYGNSKKDCINQAKAAGRKGKKEWSNESIN